MAKFYIIDQPEVDELWLVNADTRSVECLDRDLLQSLGSAGYEFLSCISDLRTDEGRLSVETRSDPSDRAFSFDGRSDPSDRAFSFDGRSELSDRAFSFGPEKNTALAN